MTALLQKAGIEAYFPQVNMQKRPYKPLTLEPLFPGYLIGRLNPVNGEIRLVQYAPGILYVVGYGGEPCPVPDQLIVSIQERLSRRNGQLAAMNYRPGDRVVITSGPLQDAAAIFDCHLSPKGRARVLIQILDRLCQAEVHIGQLRRDNHTAGTT